jgi:NitT/TauT family transport system substrate-binding protein
MRARLTVLAAAALLAAPAIAQDKIIFATNWKAQAAHGGFYQATAPTRSSAWTSPSSPAGRR